MDRGFSAAGRGLAHLASLLLRAGDIEVNPGPRFPCGECGKGVGHTSVRCRVCGFWHHARCAGLRPADVSRLARERGTWACRGCAAMAPAPPRPRTPATPRTSLPPSPQPTRSDQTSQPPPSPLARRDEPQPPPSPPARRDEPQSPPPPPARRDEPQPPPSPPARRDEPQPPPSPARRGDSQLAATNPRRRATPRDRGGLRNDALQILQLNCNGLAARMTELLKRLADSKPQVVLLQETKLTKEDDDPRIPGYNVAARRDYPSQSPTPTPTPPPSPPPSSPAGPPPSSGAGPNRTGWTCKRRGPAERETWCAGCRARKKCTVRTQPTPVPTGPVAAPSRSTASRRTRGGERGKGGVITLVREDLPFTRDPAAYAPREPDPHSYVAATRIHPRGLQAITVWNVYVPPARWAAGQGTQAQSFQPEGLSLAPNTFVGGDVNAHAAVWDPHQPEDALGRTIEEWSCDMSLTILNDGSATRMNPATGGSSAPDVTFATGGLAGGATWTTGSGIGSDHLPITTTIPTAPPKPERRGRGRPAFRKANWEQFRRTYDQLTTRWTTPAEPPTAAELDRRLSGTILRAAKQAIPFGNGGKTRAPFWNAACDAAVKARDDARKRATAQDRTADDIRAYGEARRSADRVIRDEKTAFLRAKIAELGPNQDMWGLIRALDGRKPPAKPAEPLQRPTLPGRPAPTHPATSDKEKADALCQAYAAVSRIPSDKTADRPIRLEARAAARACNCGGTRTGICSPFSMSELEAALDKIRAGKSPGPDRVANDLLKQLSPLGKRHLLELLNRSWAATEVPASWRTAEIVAIPKKGKPPSELSSYRPISLLSSTSKLAERLVQARLQHWLENSGKLNRNQAGFRRGHSTMDQVGRITQQIFDAFEQKRPQRAVLVLLDFARAYDRVWREALYCKMARLGIPGCVIRWVKALLSDRRARVRWGTAQSDSRVFKEGLPQGSVLAPLLWLIYVNDIDEGLPEGVSRSLFADDVALLTIARSAEECEAHLQPCLDSIGTWLTRWKVTPSVTKCTSTLFSLDPKEQGGRVRPKLFLHGQEITPTKNPTFLGIKFDPQLTFAEHAADLKAKMARRRRCLQAMAGKTWGSHRRTLRTAYIGYVRALFDYGAAVVGTHAAPATRERLEAEQNKCARLITGCIRLTRTDALLTEADLPPLSLRAKQLAGQECQRLSRLPALDPARTLLEKEVPPRLQYRAHRAWRRACGKAAEEERPPPKPPDEDAVLPHKPCLRRVGQWMAAEAGLEQLPTEPLALHQCRPPWAVEETPTRFVVDLPTPTRRTDPPEKRKEAALRAINLLPPADVTIWSDGSAKEGTSCGGAGARIQLHCLGREESIRAPAGAVCSSLRAELTAIHESLARVLSLPAADLERVASIRILTDSRSGLQLLQRGPAGQVTALATDIWRQLHSLGDRGTAVTLQWVPGHSGLDGNEEADRLAGEAAIAHQPEVPIDLATAKSAIGRRVGMMVDARARASHPHPAPTPGHNDLSRWEACALSQMRTGTSPLTRDVAHRLGLAADAACPACGEPDSAAHLLTACPAYEAARRRRWGLDPSLEDVLGGPAALVINYIRAVGRVDPPIDPPAPPSP